jgi:hypothetical protein
MREASAAHDRAHGGHAVNNPDGEYLLSHEPAARPSTSDEALKELRRSLIHAANRLLDRFLADRLLDDEHGLRYRGWIGADHNAPNADGS